MGPWTIRVAGSGVTPVDCTTVEPDVVFPGVSSIDTAPFRLTETAKAFGVRLSYGRHPKRDHSGRPIT
jgi:hypothetical protein